MNITKLILTTVSAAVLLTATSCVKDSLNHTPHPDKGAVLLMFEKSATETHTVLIDDQKSDFSATPFCFPALLEPGSHTMIIWNHAEGFDFGGLTARILGTRGSAQTLTFDIVFVDNNRTQHTEIDLTEVLAGFNSPTTEPFPVKGKLNTPIGMETGSAEIIDWEEGEGGDLEAGV